MLPEEVLERIEVRRPSHGVRIITMLKRAYLRDPLIDPWAGSGWVCSNDFVRAYMPRFSATIHTLRHKKGYTIAGVACTMHEHEGTVFMFRLVPSTGQQMKLEEGRK